MTTLTLITPRRTVLASATLVVALALAWQAGIVRRIAPGSAGASASAAPAAPGHASPSRVVAEGRVVAYPGAEVVVGTDLAGTIARLPVEEEQVVRRGQLVAELRADDLRAELDQARAGVAEAEADVRLYELETERAGRLVAEAVESPQYADLQRRNLDAARARRETALAAVRRLEAQLDKTRIVAPIDGTVVERRIDRGESVEAGATLLTIADLERLRIEAEVDEFDAARVRSGAPVTIVAEGYDGRTWRGAVETIPDRVVPREFKMRDPSRPSDTRVLLVKIAFAEPNELKLGQRVEISID